MKTDTQMHLETVLVIVMALAVLVMAFAWGSNEQTISCHHPRARAGNAGVL